MFEISKKSGVKKQGKRGHIEPEVSSKICNNHSNPITYPSEYSDCPACTKEKLTRLVLNF